MVGVHVNLSLVFVQKVKVREEFREIGIVVEECER